MHDPSDIGLVDAHAKRHGGHHASTRVPREVSSYVSSITRGETGVVGPRFDAAIPQLLRDAFTVELRPDVNDGRPFTAPPPFLRRFAARRHVASIILRS